MAYSQPWYKNAKGAAAQPLGEEIPPGDIEPRRLVHGDLHTGNVLFGKREPCPKSHVDLAVGYVWPPVKET